MGIQNNGTQVAEFHAIQSYVFVFILVLQLIVCMSAQGQGGIPVLPQQMQTLGQLQMAMLHDGGVSVASAKTKGPKKNKADKKHVIELPAIIDDKTPFVPPAAALKR